MCKLISISLLIFILAGVVAILLPGLATLMLSSKISRDEESRCCEVFTRCKCSQSSKIKNWIAELLTLEVEA